MISRHLRAAKLPGEGLKGILRPCFHCKESIVVSQWDEWNGFLLRCPHCRLAHGKNWKVKSILWASFFVSAFSFFFTVRPRKALLLVSIYLGIGFAGNMIIDREIFPQWLEFIAVVFFLFTPLLMNGALIVVHESRLGRSPNSKKGQVISLLEEILGFFN